MPVEVFAGATGTGGTGATTPTTMQADLTVAAHTQMLFRQQIITGSHRIIIDSDASLISV